MLPAQFVIRADTSRPLIRRDDPACSVGREPQLPVVAGLHRLAGEHVVFDLLDSFLPERIKRWQAVVSNLDCAVLLACAAWFVFGRANRTQAMGDTTAQLLIPISPFHFAAAALLALCALMHLYLAATRQGRV